MHAALLQGVWLQLLVVGVSTRQPLTIRHCCRGYLENNFILTLATPGLVSVCAAAATRTVERLCDRRGATLLLWTLLGVALMRCMEAIILWFESECKTV
jgi:hypothetical protein